LFFGSKFEHIEGVGVAIDEYGFSFPRMFFDSALIAMHKHLVPSVVDGNCPGGYIVSKLSAEHHAAAEAEEGVALEPVAVPLADEEVELVVEHRPCALKHHFMLEEEFVEVALELGVEEMAVEQFLGFVLHYKIMDEGDQPRRLALNSL
jgi:hypothetical protein